MNKSKAKRAPPFRQAKRLVGTWKCSDGFSDVEFKIRLKNGVFVISGIDLYDQEVPDVYEVSWKEKLFTLSFSTHWASTGRFTKYRFMPAPIAGRMLVTYTYTAKEVWEKI